MLSVEVTVPSEPEIEYDTDSLNIPCCRVIELILTGWPHKKFYGILAGGADNKPGKYMTVFAAGDQAIMHTRLSDIAKWRLAPSNIKITIVT
jgi:hypothetical protein